MLLILSYYSKKNSVSVKKSQGILKSVREVCHFIQRILDFSFLNTELLHPLGNYKGTDSTVMSTNIRENRLFVRKKSWQFEVLVLCFFLQVAPLCASFGQRHMKMCLWAYVDSKGPDQPANLCSLIRAFTVY